MINVFNTVFEISLRVLLILESSNKPMTADMLTAVDLITVHGKEFGVLDFNLHGDNQFNFSENAARDATVIAAVKSLTLDGLLSIRHTNSGFAYSLSKGGTVYCAKLVSGYAEEYRSALKKTLPFLENENEPAVLKKIFRLSVNSIKPSEV